MEIDICRFTFVLSSYTFTMLLVLVGSMVFERCLRSHVRALMRRCHVARQSDKSSRSTRALSKGNTVIERNINYDMVPK